MRNDGGGQRSLAARLRSVAGRARRWGGRIARRVAGKGNAAPAPQATVTAARRKKKGRRAKKGAATPASRILGSVLFDDEWYSQLLNKPRLRGLRAARHYLRKGAAAGYPPHPLFDPDVVRAAAEERLDADTPALLAYLGDRSLHDLPTHPLFDTEAYLAANPAARKHREGPLAHYVEFGALQGLAPNGWFDPNPVAEPGGLVDWMRERTRSLEDLSRATGPEWRSRANPVAQDFITNHPGLRPKVDHKAKRPLASVVVFAGHDAELLRRTLESVAAQTVNAWQLVVVDEGRLSGLSTLLGEVVGGATVHVLPHQGDRRARLLNRATDVSEGDFVTWLTVGDRWEPARLARVAGLAQRDETVSAYDGVRRTTGDGKQLHSDHEVTLDRIRGGHRPDLGRFLVRREVLVNELFDEELPHGAELDLVVRLLQAHRLSHVPVVGVERDDAAVHQANRLSPRFRPWPDHEHIRTWNDVVVNERLLDWSGAEELESVPDLVTVVIPTYADSEMTSEAVSAICRHGAGGRRLQVIVWDNGCETQDSLVLASLPMRFEGVEVHHSRTNHGFALGNNMAVRHARGEHLVFLNNDTEVQPGWLEPLVDAVAGNVIGAQSLLLFADGTIQCAGIAFPSGGGLPHELLRGFPSEDADFLTGAELNAVTGAALCVRRKDFVRVGGFDPVFRNGMEDVDLCLRLSEGTSGRFRVVPSSRVVHHESQTPGRFTSSISNRAVFVDRWNAELPRDDVGLWARAGVEVTAHQIRNVVTDDRRLCQPTPVMRRATSIREGAPRLRWAIKNPAPAGRGGEKWGDTHFARSLAGALRSLGQEVVIDARDAWYRESGYLDDVTLALRGLTSFRPAFGQVNLGWMISHPEAMSRNEAGAYDRLFVASLSYPRRLRTEWGIDARPLLQATDPERFHPDRGRPDTGHQLLFVGGSRQVFRPVVKYAVEAGAAVAIYGSEWEPFVPANLIRGQFLPNHELGDAYRSATLVLNDHWDSMREDGLLSNRLFDAVASGARVISDDVEGIEELFGRSVAIVRSSSDVARILGMADLDAVFGGNEERRGVAERVAKEHCFLARAEQLLEAALEVRAAGRHG